MSERDKIGEDIAVIKNEIRNLSKNFEDYKRDNREFCGELTKKLDITEGVSLTNKERISNMAVFQSVFSIIVGAIATYLGIKK